MSRRRQKYKAELRVKKEKRSEMINQHFDGAKEHLYDIARQKVLAKLKGQPDPFTGEVW